MRVRDSTVGAHHGTESYLEFTIETPALEVGHMEKGENGHPETIIRTPRGSVRAKKGCICDKCLYSWSPAPVSGCYHAI